jgi:Short C-terminal domain
MQNLTPDGARIVTDVANRHRVSVDAALTLLGALVKGNGTQAQFDHPDLGGMGQWSQGGMIMIGDMFNQGLKHRVDALCTELASLLRSQPQVEAEAGRLPSQSQSGGAEASLFVAGFGSTNQWWPVDLGRPASTGAQNELRYAYFAGPRRLAIQQGGQVRVYDTGEHRISGFSQQQGGDQSLTFTSQFGLVRVAELPLVLPQGDPSQSPLPSVGATPQQTRGSMPSTESAATATTATPAARLTSDDILKTIERLADLRQKNILTEEEFVQKKAELLSRL